ncbi:MAG: SRPBCC domain-containing protein [Bacteroidetes bacterium]|nr:SRPBCC domain-containing protein [Bacteroidota bacterium]MBL6963105.1 SRPBCC domain-containing protein [Bacteroidota bacterium]
MAQRVEHRFEFSFMARDELVYTYISTPYNLSSWFADDVTAEGDIFTFTWDNSTEKAKVVKKIFKKKFVFQWIEREAEEFLTFNIMTDEVTGSTLLIIQDFEDEDEYENSFMIWENTIQKLKRIIGG